MKMTGRYYRARNTAYGVTISSGMGEPATAPSSEL